jgi:tetracycline resistance efflux pump
MRYCFNVKKQKKQKKRGKVMNYFKKTFGGAWICLVFVLFLSLPVFGGEIETEYIPSMYASFLALVPPIVAIGLALVTKEVYSSLFIGILVGGLFYSGFSFEGTITHIFNNGFLSVLSDSYNVGILIFLVILGAMVSLMNRGGGSFAFGQYAKEKIKTRTGAQLATIALGILIFIDDYFNCLTVGSVMKPVTDGHKISRAKLAYLIDSTAAPVCIIAPISSWAAAVSGFVEGEDGFSIFIKAIPFNFYAIFTIIMMIALVLLHVDFGPMKAFEEKAKREELPSEDGKEEEGALDNKTAKGRVLDLLIPIISLILCCVIGMIYTGGFFGGSDFVTAFSNSDASVGLALGSICAIIITVIIYLIRKVLTFHQCMECLPEGFKAMVPAILILTFAWTLKAMTDSLGAAEFVAGAMRQNAGSLMNFLPSIIFLVACFLAFSTGTSWGTFGILIPIVVDVFSVSNPQLMIISISACMAGAVCGDHCSPISDTTIMASAGAQCNHVNHVTTQIPYVLVVASVSFLTYIIAGFVKSPWICLPIGMLLLFPALLLMKGKG